MDCADDFSPFELNLNHKYLRCRRTKIVATIGPASDSEQRIRQLIKCGLNVARINFSHGEAADHLRTISLIRRVARSLKTSVAVLGDLCGPKVRVGKFKNGGVTLKEGTVVRITVRPVLGDEKCFQSQYLRLVRDVKPGEPILLDDGNLELKVVRKGADYVEARVVRGGLLKDKKGMNMPKSSLSVPALTKKDKADLQCCLKAGVDYVALSFVKRPSDVRELRGILRREKSDVQIIAKIEMPEALCNIEEIVRLSDGIMVARGDLGVELPAKKVPMIQNRLIQIANRHDKPVIVATQMLESMIDHPRPTRAEVTDVASACMAGADAVMLSAETASGKNPVQALCSMDEILRETEAYQFFALGGRFGSVLPDRSSQLHEALGTATAQLSRDLSVHCVFALTYSGYTARMISAQRPAAPILAATRSVRVMQKMNLLWGVVPLQVHRHLSALEYKKWGEGVVRKMKLGKKGDYLIFLTGTTGTVTDTILLHKIEK
jgi:pyruvate kinase